MIEHLTDRHKECLKELVKLVREGTIPEEFHVFYGLEGPVVVGADGKGFCKSKALRPLA